MSYKIVIDSCGELLEEWKGKPQFESIPLTLYVDGYEIVDDETFDQADFLRRVAQSDTYPKSACPSPQSYRDSFDSDADHIYGITLSAELSGSYNSAMTGRQMALEDHPEKQIHVFNSRSASIGQTLIGLKIQECEEKGLPFEEIVSTVEAYIDSQITYFVLESLEALRKNGRLSRVKAFVATALKIKPVMQSTPEGNICQIDQARGINRALERMAEHIAKNTVNPQNRILAISHCNCPQRAEMVSQMLNEKLHPVRTIVVDTAGVSSLYASDGGIIVVI
ncbi:MAG: DegV family protein [Blautia sp.]|nr:DegV family protein [Blautia sp.]